MLALAYTVLFAFALMVAIGSIVATVQPQFDRIVRLLRFGPMVDVVEVPAMRDPRVRRITPRRAAARTAWLEAA